jgi:hypothetical protein
MMKWWRLVMASKRITVANYTERWNVVIWREEQYGERVWE